MSIPELSTTKINLSLTHVLVLDASAHSLDIIAQILKGFGANEVHRCSSIADAEGILNRTTVDLILVDPALKLEDGYEFLRTLRTRGPERNRFAPIVLISGHSQTVNVERARDTGANFFVVKPLSPKILLDRILWIARDQRAFIEVENKYCGPDRRFKFMGPPAGTDGRRSTDLRTPLGEASEPNMSQDDIETLIKPQRVSL